MKNVLVLCTGNSCRSQMAQGYLENLSDKNKVKIYSAGVETHGLNPKAVSIMLEDDIDISGNTSNKASEYSDIDFDFVITVCDNAEKKCPVFLSKAVKLHYDFPDPAAAEGSDEEIYFQFLTVREMIKMFCEDFVEENNLA
jgi:arsenate reductase (thioredoxin)